MLAFTVLTPCRQAAPLLAETIESVVTQTAVRSGRVTLDYVVLDAASTDRTADVVAECTSSNVRFVSQPDHGMYDALARELRRVPASSICCYLNAGDFYFKSAFDTVADVLEQHASVDWLTGLHVTYNDRSQVIRARLPFRYRRRLLRAGWYDGRRLPMVQQESTFWRATLHDGVDWDAFSRFRLAGDAFLWQCFADR
jgi:glycosyltransferase involved in cell wall biosynthesis